RPAPAASPRPAARAIDPSPAVRPESTSCATGTPLGHASGPIRYRYGRGFDMAEDGNDGKAGPALLHLQQPATGTGNGVAPAAPTDAARRPRVRVRALRRPVLVGLTDAEYLFGESATRVIAALGRLGRVRRRTNVVLDFTGVHAVSEDVLDALAVLGRR